MASPQAQGQRHKTIRKQILLGDRTEQPLLLISEVCV
ncbi:hypothetical protein GGQ17_001257 [Salinibacter ruber]|nr:hypothetical protein [Salinibacter ruber]